MINTKNIRIISIGKVKKTWIKDGIKSYLRRLPGISIKEIKDSNSSKESETIISSIMSNESLVVLGEEFKTYSSIEFANKLDSISSNKYVFIIGGPDGLPDEIKNRSSWKLSLSPLTFPHELAQLLLLEQIYRANTILQGHQYHRK
tara:strand:+ start:801 stop:1238 length:438 start_codon:yes stop_codon:yes gene_type:complete